MKMKKKRKHSQIPGPCQGAEKAMEHEGGGDTSCTCYTWNSSQRPEKETWGTGDPKKNQGHQDQSSVKISLNTLKSPGDMRRLAVFPISVKKTPIKTGIKKIAIIEII